MKRILFAVLVVSGVASADKSFIKGTTWDCKKDPIVAINKGDGTYTFKGACKTIAINGGDVTLKAESVDEIEINGGGCKVTLGTVGTINVNGAENKVTWKKAKSGDKPAVNVNGADNSVDQAK
ncbi:MAG: DUF3060 domain-containing protein [Deltaproteobacteria bacterium]|nr:DUF3060 domain-containing protein [Deltaproteobacteria bacterium]